MASWDGPGLVDHHVHLLRVAAGDRPTYDVRDPASIAAFHHAVAAAGSTPMDEEPVAAPDESTLASRLRDGLQRAADLGLVAVTEAGMSDWRHLDALLELRAAGPLPTRVKVLVASGLAERTGPMLRRTGDDAVEVIGVKLYADGWLGPRTCALCRPFDDTGGDGVLFLDADALARRAAPFAEAGWTIATHAIGDRAVAAVLDGYEQVYGDDCREAAPRIEHAQVLSHELIARMAELGVVACIQPSFATSDAATAVAALGDRVDASYRWDRLLAAGVRVIAGSDFPIETLDPRVGLQRLVEGCAISPALPFDAALAMMTDAAEGATRWDRHPGAAGGTDAASIPVVALPA